MRRTLLLLMLLASPASAQITPPADGLITCTSPVSVSDSARSLMQRYGTTAEQAAAILFLASDEARNLTGGVHDIDGGFSITA